MARALKRVKEALRGLPEKGLGYGLLRYLNPQTAAELARLPRRGFRSIIWAGSGRRDRATGSLREELKGELKGERDELSAEPSAVPAEGALRLGGGDPAMALSHALSINALTFDGAGGSELVAEFGYARSLLDEAEVRALGERWFAALGALARHAAAASGAGGRTPERPAAGCRLTQDEIERLEGSASAAGGCAAAVAVAGGAAVPCAV